MSAGHESRRGFLRKAGTSLALLGAPGALLDRTAQAAPGPVPARGAIKLTGIETYALAFPTERPIADAIHVFADRGSVVVKATTDAGITGWGETYFGTISGAPKTLKYLIDQELAPVAIGADPFDSRRVRADLWRAIEYQGMAGLTYFGVTALDMALWDICGKAVGLPVHKLLGSCHEKMPAYAMVGWYYDTEDEYVRSCAEVVEEGFKAVKVKVGAGTLAEDIKRLELARKAVGPDVRLMADANQAYSVNEAIRRGRAYEEYDLFWFEEPLPPQLKDGYAEVADALDIPIATGENEYTRFAFAELIKKGGVDIAQPDLRRAGGVVEWLEIGAIADVAGIPLASHGGGLAELNILCAIPNAIYMESGSLKGQGGFPERLVMKDGAILAPQAPGLGSEVRPEYIKKYRVA